MPEIVVRAYMLSICARPRVPETSLQLLYMQLLKIGVIMVMLGRLESNQRGTYFQSTVLVEAKTAQVVPHTLTHHEHSTSKLHGAPTHSTAHTKHK